MLRIRLAVALIWQVLGSVPEKLELPAEQEMSPAAAITGSEDDPDEGVDEAVTAAA